MDFCYVITTTLSDNEAKIIAGDLVKNISRTFIRIARYFFISYFLGGYK